MAYLTSRSLQKLNACVRDIYANPDLDTFANHVVSTASKIIPASVTSFAKITGIKQHLNYVGITSCRHWEHLEAFGRGMHEHPILNFLHPKLLKQHRFADEIEKAIQKSYPSLKSYPHSTAARTSDVLTNRQFQSLGIYNDFFHRNGVDYQLLISFLPKGDTYSMISFNRDRFDFSAEELLILNLLQPHIVQAHNNAEQITKARQAFIVLERSSGHPANPFGLTYREEDVLYWVAQGKANAEVAIILGIAPGTVKIHLERIYQKLGVENRTAAARAAMSTHLGSALRS